MASLLYCLFFKEGLSVAQVGLTLIYSLQWVRVLVSLSLLVQRSQMPRPCLEEQARAAGASPRLCFYDQLTACLSYRVETKTAL